MEYQVGGSLISQASCYVERNADSQLYTALKQSEFCYVLNSRQVGKSSLLVRTKNRLQKEGFVCTTVDMTNIGSENITPLQWYKGIATSLWSELDLVEKLHLKTWWKQAEDVSLVQKLSLFIDELILVHFSKQNIIIFIDEIDTILSLDFQVDDFFALIRFYYNKRANNPEFNRLTFAVFGVATPSDLIQDKNRTPFNIGKAIELQGFVFDEAQGLAQGLAIKQADSQAVLKAILSWTGGQPFLTQKICKLIKDLASKQPHAEIIVPPGTENFWIENIVKSLVINKWEFQDEPEHLRTVRDRLLCNPNRIGRLLGIYQQILYSIESEEIAPVLADDSREQIELILSGLVVKQEGFLRVKNRIYQEVFNLEWVEKQLEQLRPYSQTFDAWKASRKTDTSRLLRGQALIDAQNWARGKSLSDADYQFLAASEELDRIEVQQGLEVARLKEVETRLAQEKKAARKQRILLASVSVALAIASGLGVATFWQYRLAQVSEVKAIISASHALYASNRRLDALVQAIKGNRKAQQLGIIPKPAMAQVEGVLRQAVYGSVESNSIFIEKPLTVDISPNGEAIAAGGADKTVKIWKPDGTLLWSLQGHQAGVVNVKFSPDGKTIVSTSLDGVMKLWQASDGKLLRTIAAHQAVLWRIAISPDSQIIATASSDNTVKLWRIRDGQLIRTITGHRGSVASVAFSPDSRILISSGVDKTIKLWQISDGTLLKTLTGHTGKVWDVQCSSKGIIASASADNTIKLWTRSGKLLKTLVADRGAVRTLAFNQDGSLLASAGADKSIKLWRTDGTLLRTLEGHVAQIWQLAISSHGNIIASASADNSIKLWNPEVALQRVFQGHQAVVWDIAFNSDGSSFATASGDSTVKIWKPDSTLLRTLEHDSAVIAVTYVPTPQGNTLISGSADGTIRFWQQDGTLLRTIKAHKAQVMAVASSPDNQIIASGGDDFTIKLWRRQDGKLLKTLKGHDSMVLALRFSRDGKTIVSTGTDRTIKVWTIEGKLLQTLAAHSKGIWGLDFSPDGKTLASSSMDGTIKLWHQDNSGKFQTEPDKTFATNSTGLLRVAFSPDGEKIAAGGVDGTVKVWRKDGTLLTSLTRHNGIVLELAFSPDSSKIISVGDDQVAIMWDLQHILKLNLMQYGCNWVKDYLRINPRLDPSDRQLCNRVSG